jgi:hypothetical protein
VTGKSRTYNEDWHKAVPGALSRAEIDATIRLIKTLAADLDYDKPNFGMTVEGIVAHAHELSRHERKLRSYNRRNP